MTTQLHRTPRDLADHCDTTQELVQVHKELRPTKCPIYKKKSFIFHKYFVILFSLPKSRKTFYILYISNHSLFQNKEKQVIFYEYLFHSILQNKEKHFIFYDSFIILYSKIKNSLFQRKEKQFSYRKC